MTEKLGQNELLALTTEIVASHVSNNTVAVSDLGELIRQVYGSLNTLSPTPAPEQPERPQPAVAIKKSVTPEYIICLEDGKKLKMLKRHLMTAYGMTPEDYQAKWGLRHNYPMVAPNYALKRRELAKKIGLGRKPGVVEPVPAPKAATRRKPRAKKVAA
jgi:predicted transcriptional regulator